MKNTKNNLTLAKTRSLVFLNVTLTKQAAGNTTHISTPIVEPTSPNTSSMLGMSRLMNKATATIATVMQRNVGSGIEWLIMWSWWDEWT